MIGREVCLHWGWLISGSSYMALSGMFPSSDHNKSVRSLSVGDQLVFKKQEWGQNNKITWVTKLLFHCWAVSWVGPNISQGGMNMERTKGRTTDIGLSVRPVLTTSKWVPRAIRPGPSPGSFNASPTPNASSYSKRRCTYFKWKIQNWFII